MLDLKIIQPNQLKKYKVAIARRTITLGSTFKKKEKKLYQNSSQEYCNIGKMVNLIAT